MACTIAVVRGGLAVQLGQHFPRCEGGDGAFASGADMGVSLVGKRLNDRTGIGSRQYTVHAGVGGGGSSMAAHSRRVRRQPPGELTD